MSTTLFLPLSLLVIASLARCSSEPLVTHPPRACMTLAADGGTWPPPYDPSGPIAKAVGDDQLVWPIDVALVVRFLDGTPWQQAQVRKHAKTWTTAAKGKIRFTYLTPGDAGASDIRITFDTEESKSCVGTNANYYPNTATMWFGWVTTAQALEDSTQIQSVILHEFGHALGLNHEHQHPEASIPWDVEAVYKYFADHDKWRRGQVDTNIFMPYSGIHDVHTGYDKLSIMHYWVPDTLTIGKFEIPATVSLSDSDVVFIRRLYGI